MDYVNTQRGHGHGHGGEAEYEGGGGGAGGGGKGSVMSVRPFCESSSFKLYIIQFRCCFIIFKYSIHIEISV